MALAQAEVGMIPQWAADEIAHKARLENFDPQALEQSVAETMAPIVSLVRMLTQVCGEAGKFVHWGGTTQNIMATGRLLLLRRAHHAMLSHIAGATERLGDLATTHAATIMAGRTNNRHALPITFGFKVAGWIEELSRQNERFVDIEPRVFALYFGGAIGAMHAFGPSGHDLSIVLARRLNLSTVLVPSRATLDSQAEYVASLGLFAMTVGRIAEELFRLMTEEIGEVSERHELGVIGSSTMPHKVNPKHVVDLIAMAAQLRSKVAPALEAGLAAFEGDASANRLMAATLESAATLAWDVSKLFEKTIAGLDVHPEAMARNLSISASYIASERLTMMLAVKIGKSHAHDVVHHAVSQTLTDGKALNETLLDYDDVASNITATEIAEALDPANYLGDSQAMSLIAARLAVRVAGEMRERTQLPDNR